MFFLYNYVFSKKVERILLAVNIHLDKVYKMFSSSCDIRNVYVWGQQSLKINTLGFQCLKEWASNTVVIVAVY